MDDGTGRAALADSDLGLRRSSGRVELFVAAGRPGSGFPPRGGSGRADAPPGRPSPAASAARSPGSGISPTAARRWPPRSAALSALRPRPMTAGSHSDRAAGSPRNGHLRLGPRTSASDRATSASDRAIAVIAAPLGRLTGAQIVLIGTLLRSGEVIRPGSGRPGGHPACRPLGGRSRRTTRPVQPTRRPPPTAWPGSPRPACSPATTTPWRASPPAAAWPATAPWPTSAPPPARCRATRARTGPPAPRQLREAPRRRGGHRRRAGQLPPPRRGRPRPLATLAGAP